MKYIEYLKGKKTYITAVLALCVFGLGYAGVLDIETVDSMLTVLGFGAVIALRSAISGLGSK